MGTDKCDLLYKGHTLLNYQINKFKNLGIEDIVASGYRGDNCNAKVVSDDLMKGPLSGILKGLEVIKNDRAFVISVDAPLLKDDTINKVIDFSFEKDLQIALISHRGVKEPLMGVFKKEIIDNIIKVVESEKHSVMKLVDLCNYDFIEIDDDDKFFINVNYKDDYNKLLEENL